jgi:hypothetical protein
MESRFAQYVGRESAPRVYDVERGHIRRFAEAIGDDHPMYQAIDGECIAPPTFATALRPNDPREGVEIDFRKLLHGEQEFRYERPLRAGDRVTVVGKIAEAYVKEGKAGAMDFLVLETRGTDAKGDLIFTARSTAVIKR